MEVQVKVAWQISKNFFLMRVQVKVTWQIPQKLFCLKTKKVKA